MQIHIRCINATDDHDAGYDQHPAQRHDVWDSAGGGGAPLQRAARPLQGPVRGHPPTQGRDQSGGLQRDVVYLGNAGSQPMNTAVHRSSTQIN